MIKERVWVLLDNPIWSASYNKETCWATVKTILNWICLDFIWCFWLVLWVIYWPLEEALKINKLNWINHMDVISKLLVQLINWKFVFNWHIKWQFNWLINSQFNWFVNSQLKGLINSQLKGLINSQLNWLINSQLKPAGSPTTDFKPWVNLSASLWIKWHPDPWSWHGRHKILWYSLMDLWIVWLPSHSVESAFHLPGVDFLPSNQLQTTHWGLSNFNNKNLGLSAVKIDRNFGLIRDSFYCFIIAHFQWGNG